MYTTSQDIFTEQATSAFEKLKLAGIWEKATLSLREEAFQHFLDKGLPTMKEEEWKYTSIKKAFSSAWKEENTAKLSDNYSLPEFPSESIQLVYINGVFSTNHSKLSSLNELTLLPDAHPSPEILSGEIGDDTITSLHRAFTNGGPVIQIKGHLKETIYLIHLITGNASPFHPVTRISVDHSSSANMEEVIINAGNGYALGNMRTEINVRENAILHYIKYQDIQAEKFLVDNTIVRVARNAKFHIYTCTFSGEIVRNNLEILLKGEASEAHLHGLYLLKDNTQCDNRTLVDHAVPNCYSNELYKGIIGDAATGVFNGKIIVRPDAQKTNAFQSNRNILTSEGANIYTKPQLEIFADDVKCSHGATSSQLDNKEVFYLQSRGITKKKAEAMLMMAFAAETLDGIPDINTKEKLEQIIANQLEVSI